MCLCCQSERGRDLNCIVTLKQNLSDITEVLDVLMVLGFSF